VWTGLQGGTAVVFVTIRWVCTYVKILYLTAALVFGWSCCKSSGHQAATRLVYFENKKRFQLRNVWLLVFVSLFVQGPEWCGWTALVVVSSNRGKLYPA
jgi:hypothetical protein